MPLDPLQKRPHKVRWPEIESDDLVGLLPPAGPPTPTVITTPAESGPPPWPVQATTQLVRLIEQQVDGAIAVAETGGRPTPRPGVTTYSPFDHWG